MKKQIFNLFYSLTFLITFLVFSERFIKIKTQQPYALASLNSTYAKVKSGCVLYKSSNTTLNDPENLLFEIPESYFVTILQEKDNLVKVKYDSFVGYVDSQFLSAVNFTPKVQTLKNITFSISPDAGTQLKSEPSTESSSQTLITIPANTTNINYIAKVSSVTPIGGTSDVWFFAQYSPETNPTSVYTGYIYSERTANLTSITLNPEDNPAPAIEPTETETLTIDDDSYSLTKEARLVLIAFICLPIIILFIIFSIKAAKKQSQHNADTQSFSSPISTGPSNSPEPTKRTIKAFKGKVFDKKDSLKTFLNSAASETNTATSSLEAIDQDDENLL